MTLARMARPARTTGVALSALLLPLGAVTAAQATTSAQVSLQAPSTVRAGEELLVRVDATGLAGAAGYELGLRYPAGAFRLTSALPGENGALVPVSPAERADGVRLAAWSRGPGGTGSSQALEVVLTAQRTGPVDLALDQVRLVDATGHRLPVRVRRPSVPVRVVGDSVAPAQPPAAGVPALRPGRAPGDLTGDRSVDLQDVHEVELAWTADAQAGCTRDCVDIGDLQAYAHAAALAPAPAPATPVAEPIRLTVTSTGDEDDIGTDALCRTAVGTCTLRAALTESKRQGTTPVVIGFALPGAGPFVISPQTRLPSLSNPAGVTIDGYSQAGAAVNTSAAASNAVLKVSLAGQGPTGIDGLVVFSTGNTIRGLSVYEFRKNIWLYGSGAGNNKVIGSYLGTDPAGTRTATRDQAGASGITLQGGAYANRIGSPVRADRNVISGNYQNGVATYDSPTRGTTIQGNLIGLNPAGTARLGNRTHGIDINTSTTYTTVGGTAAGAGNVLSGNLGEGVEVSHGAGNKFNNIVGNLIGTDPTGTSAPAYAGNRQWGVRLEGAQTCDPCGDDAGPSLVADNTIVHNGKGGLLVDKGFHDATVRDNRIGVLPGGTAAGNGLWGVRVAHGAKRIQVGPANTIAYNDQGVQVDGIGVSPNDATSQPTNARITRNSIYANRDGLGIDLTPLGTVNTAANADRTINDGLLAPTLTRVLAGSATGTTCAGCTVEAFQSDRPAGSTGAGRRFIAGATADGSGRFTIDLDAAVQGGAVTVTATNGGGRTSEFSKNVAVPRAAA